MSRDSRQDSKVNVRAGGATKTLSGRGRGVNPFVLSAVLGALALGVLPAAAKRPAHAAPPQSKTVADTGSAPRAAAPAARADTAPMRAFLARAKRMKDQGKLDLSRPREVTIEADRAEDGTLSNAAVTGASAADANFRRLAQDFVSSLNESRSLRPLKDVSRVRMTFALDGQRFTMHTASETPSEARADEMARGYRVMVNAGRIIKRGTDTAVVLNNMKISASGKRLLMSLDMPREQMGNILLKQITPN